MFYKAEFTRCSKQITKRWHNTGTNCGILWHQLLKILSILMSEVIWYFSRSPRHNILWEIHLSSDFIFLPQMPDIMFTQERRDATQNKILFFFYHSFLPLISICEVHNMIFKISSDTCNECCLQCSQNTCIVDMT